MKRDVTPDPHLEPELEELSRYRAMIALERVPMRERLEVLASARMTLFSPSAVRVRWSRPVSPWMVVALSLVSSAAFAATPPGQRVVFQVRKEVRAWFGVEESSTDTARRNTTKTGGRDGMPSIVPSSAVREASSEGSKATSEPRENGHASLAFPDVVAPSAQSVVKSARRGEVAPQPGGSPVKTSEAVTSPAARVDLKHQEGARAASATTPGDASPGAKWGDESVAQERDLLERALVALRQGDARAALSLTAEHQRRFPSGLLRPERDDVERKALDVLRIKEGGSVQ